MPINRKDLLGSTQEMDNHIHVAHEIFNGMIGSNGAIGNEKTPGAAKEITEVMDLIRLSILDKVEREGKTESGKIDVIYEYTDRPFERETISISIVERLPGSFSRGTVGEGNVRNLKPSLREIVDDPEYDGYKYAVYGMYYDNVIRLTAWASTNKQANNRALWLEEVIEEYSWYYKIQGANRLLPQGWKPMTTLVVSNNTFYGRPIDYYVRTEHLWNIRQKTLEDIYIKLVVTDK